MGTLIIQYKKGIKEIEENEIVSTPRKSRVITSNGIPNGYKKISKIVNKNDFNNEIYTFITDQCRKGNINYIEWEGINIQTKNITEDKIKNVINLSPQEINNLQN